MQGNPYNLDYPASAPQDAKFLSKSSAQNQESQSQWAHIDYLYWFLKKSSASYISLVDSLEGQNDQASNIYNKFSTSNGDVHQTVVDAEQEHVMYEQARDHCLVQGITDDQQMMIGLV